MAVGLLLGRPAPPRELQVSKCKSIPRPRHGGRQSAGANIRKRTAAGLTEFCAGRGGAAVGRRRHAVAAVTRPIPTPPTSRRAVAEHNASAHQNPISHRTHVSRGTQPGVTLEPQRRSALLARRRCAQRATASCSISRPPRRKTHNSAAATISLFPRNKRQTRRGRAWPWRIYLLQAVARFAGGKGESSTARTIKTTPRPSTERSKPAFGFTLRRVECARRLPRCTVAIGGRNCHVTGLQVRLSWRYAPIARNENWSDFRTQPLTGTEPRPSCHTSGFQGRDLAMAEALLVGEQCRPCAKATLWHSAGLFLRRLGQWLAGRAKASSVALLAPG